MYKKGNIKPGSIISILYNNIDIDFMVLGININTDNSTKDINYIDLMSTKCILKDVVWDKKDIRTEELTSDTIFLSYKKSTIIKKIDNIDKDISDHIIPRVIDTITSIDNHSINIGKIWIPSITELYGKEKGNCCCDSLKEEQYPIFKENIEKAILNQHYLTRSHEFHNSNYVYCFDPGIAIYLCDLASNEHPVPICFRLEV